MTSTTRLDDGDLAQLRDRGIGIDEVQRQLLCFQRPPNWVELVRPCTVGDGVVVLDERDLDRLVGLHAEAAAAGRITKFVPASGAASRMFRDLHRFLLLEPRERPDWDAVGRAAAGGDRGAAALRRFVEELPEFAFHPDLAEAVAARGLELERLRAGGEWAPILDALLGDGGLGYGERPKGLIPFHAYPGGERRTAFEEHLVEAAAYARDARGVCRLHFTVSPEHLEGFATLLREAGSRWVERLGAKFDVEYSVQKASTDTVAVDLENRPFRGERGRLLFRPGGHGALIENLDELEGDVVCIKNIDNVQPDRAKPAVVRWKRALCGLLLRLQDEGRTLLRRLADERDAAAVDDAGAFVRAALSIEPPRRLASAPAAERRRWLADRLDRPLRVCGVVRNTGEPGGGPFWVRGRDGAVTLQIVETSQVDPESEAQRRILASSTHFNPVDLVCGLRDARGEGYDLHRFVDPDAYLVAEKSAAGRKLKALERPGLWNGAMAGWNTVLVEVPLATFSPVKTILDLLRPEHRRG